MYFTTVSWFWSLTSESSVVFGANPVDAIIFAVVALSLNAPNVAITFTSYGFFNWSPSIVPETVFPLTVVKATTPFSELVPAIVNCSQSGVPVVFGILYNA